MLIRPYLDKYRFDSETTRLLGIAFETALVADRLCEAVLTALRTAELS